MLRKYRGIPAALSACFALGVTLSPTLAAPAPNLAAGFSAPDQNAKPLTWWHWMNGNVTREGITADLESMKRVGIGGAQIFNVANKAAVDIPAGPVKYLSPQWLDLVQFAATESQRLGLTLGITNAAGWSGSGGPWVTPEHSMKHLVWSEVNASGGAKNIALPQPAAKMGFYREVAVLAFPTPAKVPSDEAKQKARDEKNGTPESSGDAIELASIVDLTGKLDAKGNLNWTAPAGNWTVMRFGYSTSGEMNRPAPPSATGLEVDKFSRPAIDAFWKGGVQPIIDKLGPLSGRVMNTILIDSYEAGQQSWTDEMSREFETRRGYDLTRYLPTYAAYKVGGDEQTKRFQWDLRRTMADLFADNYYGYMAEKCHRAGLQLAAETYGNGGFEAMTAGAHVDQPMGEFWVNRGIHYSPKVAASIGHTNGQRIIGAESFTAQPEHGKWQNSPASLKNLGDLMWTNGINRYVLHGFTHQPWTDKFPGMTMGQWGTHFGRTNTWWEQSDGWMQYIARSQSLLQAGQPVADLLYFPGEFPALGTRTEDPELRAAGYDYDLVGTDLMQQLRVENGNLVLPNGLRYRVMFMRGGNELTPQLAAKVRDLVAAGATVIGNKPDGGSPSLQDYPRADAVVKAIAEQVWGDGKAKKGNNTFGKGRVYWNAKPLEVLRELKVAPDFASDSADELLYIHRAFDDADVYFVSHQGESAKMVNCKFRSTGRVPEVWNPKTGAIQTAGLWKAEANGTRVTLPMEAGQSLFVVFRKPAIEGATTFASVASDAPFARLPEFAATDNKTQMLAWQNGQYTLTTSAGAIKSVGVQDVPAPIVLSNPWTVNFTPNWGAPSQIAMPQLQDWTKNADASVRYYSGTGTYRTTLNVPAEFLAKSNRVELDLGRVEVLAQVIVNGRDLGVAWSKPYRVDVTDAVKASDNALEIRVTNLWPNRLIGDEEYPSDVQWDGRALVDWPDWLKRNQPRPSSERRTFATWKHYSKGDALLPSGLLGPVVVRAAQTVDLE